MSFKIHSRIDHVDDRTYKILVFAIPDEVTELSTRSLTLEATADSVQEADAAVIRMCGLLACELRAETDERC